jgi:glycosyltransferase involved in cell wall biosynthesis
VQVVGSVLVRNEDVFLERAIRNVAVFCDRIHAVDHLSTDRTWELLQELARTYDHLDVRRASFAGASHEVLEPYVGTDTWALRVDGDEIYDPSGLARMRAKLDAGDYGDRFRIQGSVLHSDGLDADRHTASGYLSPPSRPITSLFNFAALDSWRGCPERLHGGEMSFRPGYGWELVEPLYEDVSWDESPLRCLHVCFLRRSSLESNGGDARLSLAETGMYRRGVGGWLRRAVRRDYVDAQQREIQARGSSWKLEKYRRGPVVEKDVTAFFVA